MITATPDKVIVLRDEKDNIKGIIIHDQKSHHQVHYSVNEMGAEELVALYESKTIEQ